MATSTLQGNMHINKPTGAMTVATVMAKNTGKYVAGVKARAVSLMAKFGLRAKILGIIRGNERTNLYKSKNDSKIYNKSIAKIMAKTHNWTYQWKIIGLHDDMILYETVCLHIRFLKL